MNSSAELLPRCLISILALHCTALHCSVLCGDNANVCICYEHWSDDWSLVTVSGGELLCAGAGPRAAVGRLAGLQLRPGPGQHRHGAGHGGDTRAVRDTDINSVMQGADIVFCIHLPIAPLPSDLPMSGWWWCWCPLCRQG